MQRTVEHLYLWQKAKNNKIQKEKDALVSRMGNIVELSHPTGDTRI